MTVNELQYLYPCIRFEVLTVMKIKVTVIQVVVPCALIITIFTLIMNKNFSPVRCLRNGGGGGVRLPRNHKELKIFYVHILIFF
jgi:hypothetical protein